VKKVLISCLVIIFTLVIAYYFIQHLEKQRKGITEEVLEKSEIKKFELQKQNSILRFVPKNSFFLTYFKKPERLLNSLSESEIYKTLIGQNDKFSNEDLSLLEKGKEALNEAGTTIKSEFIKKILGEDFVFAIFPESNQKVDILILTKPTVKTDYIEKTLELLDFPSKENNVVEKIPFKGKTITSVKEKFLDLHYFYSFTNELTILASDIDMVKDVIVNSSEINKYDSIFDNKKFKNLQNILSDENQGIYFLDYEELTNNLDGFFKKLYLEDINESLDILEAKESLREYLQSYFCLISYGEFLVNNKFARLKIINDYHLCPEYYPRDFIKPSNFDSGYNKFVSKDSLITSNGLFEFSKYLLFLDKFKNQSETGFLDSMIDSLEENCSDNISKICSKLENHYQFHLAGIDQNTMFPIPLINLIVKFKEKSEDVKTIGNAIECLISSLMNQKGEMIPGTSYYKDLKINYLPVPFFFINISYVFIDEYLIIGSSLD